MGAFESRIVMLWFYTTGQVATPVSPPARPKLATYRNVNVISELV